ncbi:MAG: PEGA domain-containing protein [Archangium sp.]
MLPLLLIVLAAPKQAAPPPKPLLPSSAAVFVSSPDEAEAARNEAALTKALEKEGAPLVNVAAEFPTPAPDEKGMKLAAEAKQAYDDLDYDASLSKWNEALEYFVQHPSAADSKTLGDAHFYIGALAIQNGGKSQMKKGTEEFSRALLFNPELTCDPQVYGADVKKAFDKALSEVNARGTGKLALESTPPGATANVHGKDIGLTPIEDGPAVAPGRHLVSFKKPGYESVSVFTDVSKDGATAKASLKAAPGYAEVRDGATSLVSKGVGVKGALPEGSKKLGEVVKARFLVLSDGATAEVWDVETGNRVSGLSLSDEELAASAKQINEFIASPAPAAVADVKSGGEEPSAGGPVYTKWWFWTAVGVVAVGAAATAGGVAAANSRPAGFNVVLGTP